MKNPNIHQPSFEASRNLKSIIKHWVEKGELTIQHNNPQTKTSVVYNHKSIEGDKFHLTVYANEEIWEGIHWTYENDLGFKQHLKFDEDLNTHLLISEESLQWATKIQAVWNNISEEEFQNEGFVLSIEEGNKL